MATIIDILGNSTPVSETLAQKWGYVKAAIACKVFFYQQLKNGVCSARVSTIAKKLGMSAGTVSGNLRWLRENGYIEVIGEHKSGNVTNKYRVTKLFFDALEHSADECYHSADESNIQQMNGEEEVKEYIEYPLYKGKSPQKPKHQKTQKPTPADIEYYNPLAQELLSICELSIPLVNGTKLDFMGVIKFLQANHANPDMVRDFGRWYDDTPSLKVVTDQWGLFVKGKQPRKFKQNGNGAHKNRTGSKPARKPRNHIKVPDDQKMPF